MCFCCVYVNTRVNGGGCGFGFFFFLHLPKIAFHNHKQVHVSGMPSF